MDGSNCRGGGLRPALLLALAGVLFGTTCAAQTALPGKIEAEAYGAMTGVQTEATSDAGGGFDVGWIDANDWMSYQVNPAAAGWYTVQYRVASTGTT